MRTIAWALFWTASTALAARAEVTKEDVRRLLAAGVSERVVLTFIRANGPVVRLSADDLVELKAAGAGDRILSELLPDPGGTAPEVPLPARAAATPAGPAFGAAYVYDARLRSWVSLAPRRPVPALCTWGPTWTTVAPVCRPCAPVCRPAIRFSLSFRR